MTSFCGVKNIMKKQSTDVDVVSGATYSSNGLINAVKNALKEAEKVTNGQTTEPDKEKADTSELEKVMKEAEELKIEYDEKLEKFANQKEKMLEQARQEAFRITRQAKEEVDNIIKELRRLEEERASKEKNQK